MFCFKVWSNFDDVAKEGAPVNLEYFHGEVVDSQVVGDFKSCFHVLNLAKELFDVNDGGGWFAQVGFEFASHLRDQRHGDGEFDEKVRQVSNVTVQYVVHVNGIRPFFRDPVRLQIHPALHFSSSQWYCDWSHAD